jgi:hypothetical protein
VRCRRRSAADTGPAPGRSLVRMRRSIALGVRRGFLAGTAILPRLGGEFAARASARDVRSRTRRTSNRYPRAMLPFAPIDKPERHIRFRFQRPRAIASLPYPFPVKRRRPKARPWYCRRPGTRTGNGGLERRVELARPARRYPLPLERGDVSRERHATRRPAASRRTVTCTIEAVVLLLAKN